MKSCIKCGSGDVSLIVKPYRPYGITQEGHETDKAYWYECESCGYWTAYGISGKQEIFNRTITDEEAQEIALRNWDNDWTKEDQRKKLFGHYPGYTPSEHQSHRYREYIG